MNAFLIVVLALTVGGDLREPVSLVQKSGDLHPKGQMYTTFYVKKDVPVKLEAHGDGHGDLDCYLLIKNTDAWSIAAKDETNQDGCSLSYTPSLARPMRVWVANNGVHPTSYTVSVKQ